MGSNTSVQYYSDAHAAEQAASVRSNCVVQRFQAAKEDVYADSKAGCLTSGSRGGCPGVIQQQAPPPSAAVQQGTRAAGRGGPEDRHPTGRAAHSSRGQTRCWSDPYEIVKEQERALGRAQRDAPLAVAGVALRAAAAEGPPAADGARKPTASDPGHAAAAASRGGRGLTPSRPSSEAARRRVSQARAFAGNSKGAGESPGTATAPRCIGGGEFPKRGHMGSRGRTCGVNLPPLPSLHKQQQGPAHLTAARKASVSRDPAREALLPAAATSCCQQSDHAGAAGGAKCSKRLPSACASPSEEAPAAPMKAQGGLAGPLVTTRNIGGGAVGKAPEGAACKRPSGHVSRSAVSLAWLLQFAEAQRLRERGLTTFQVVEQVVVPHTAAARCRYTDDWTPAAATAAAAASEEEEEAERPAAMGASSSSSPSSTSSLSPLRCGAVSAGRPFYLVSHVWSRPFSETLGMVAQHFRPEQQRLWRRDGAGRALPALGPGDVFLWIDIFAINQHPESGQQAADLTSLSEVVADSEDVLQVLDQLGSPLTRVWCLWEAWQSCKGGGGDDGRDDDGRSREGSGNKLQGRKSKLRLLSYGIDYKHMEQVFIGLDVRAAQASVESDRQMILDQIYTYFEHSGGYDSFNHVLKSALVSGAVEQVPASDADFTPETRRRVETAGLIAKLYGQYEVAEQLFRRNLEASEKVLGQNHPDTLLAVSNLGSLLQARGKYGEAEQLSRRALGANRKVLGPNHPDTLAAVNELGSLLEAQGKYREAEPLFLQALEASEQLLGPDNPGTVASIVNLGSLLQAQGSFIEAEQMFRRAL